MRISVAYAEPDQQEWIELEAPDGTTAEEAVRMSGILEKFPHLDLEGKQLGVFGKPVKGDQALREGDRVEIYRPLKADPKKARTRRRGGEGAEGEGSGGPDAGGDQEEPSSEG